MRRRLGMLAFCIIALILVTAEPQRTSAYNWQDDFGLCVNEYGGGWFQCWNTQWAAHDDCDLLYPPNLYPSLNAMCKSQANSDRVGCTSTATSWFGACADEMDYEFESPDFCSNAIAAAWACEQFQGEDNLEAYGECRYKSQIHFCQ